jgi:DnaJ-domain-containing protein 1
LPRLALYSVGDCRGRMRPSPAAVLEELPWLAEIGHRLHDLSQPLTALQCRLELGGMDHEAESKQAAIEDALRECVRLNKRVHAMQSAVRRAIEQAR